MKPRIISLAQFNLTQEKFLKLKPDTKALVRLQWRFPSGLEKKKFSPHERNKLLAEFHREVYKQTLKLYHFKKSSIIFGTKNNPRVIEAQLPISTVARLARDRYVLAIVVRKIQGMKKNNNQIKQKSLFAVKTLAVAQIENQTKGKQMYEEQVFVAHVRSEKEAIRIVRQEFKNIKPYLGGGMKLVRWKLLDIIRVFQLLEEITLHKPLQEVYSEFSYKKITPATTWIVKKE
jgi:hypothetical protein